MLAWPAPNGVTQRIVLIRHGEPDASLCGRCYGRLDGDLSPVGKLRLAQTRRWLARAPLVAVYSSPARRATQSASIIAGDRLSISIHDDLREIDFGQFEGMTYAEISVRFPRLYAEWMTAPTTVAFPGGERFPDMASRVRRAITSIRALHTTGSIGIVSHGGVNRIALADALGLPLERMFTIDQGYACMNVIDYFGDTPLARLINAVPDAAC
jgi:alpha-ribazole phosphatase